MTRCAMAEPPHVLPSLALKNLQSMAHFINFSKYKSELAEVNSGTLLRALEIILIYGRERTISLHR